MSKKLFLLVILVSIIPHFSFSQADSIESVGNKLVFIPSLHNIQIDATSIVIINQIGAEIDLDVLRSANEEICIGTRFSVEHYYLTNFVDKIEGTPFSNFNFYARLSFTKTPLSFPTLKGGNLSISLLTGFTYYKTSDPARIPDKYLFRTGIEIKYAGMLIKGSTSFIKKTSFIGIGLYFDMNHLSCL